MKIFKRIHDSVYIFKLKKKIDNRGYFIELTNTKFLEKIIKKKINFFALNLSKSKKNVFRGFHYQVKPFQQDKLLRVVSGAIINFGINLDKKSKYYKKIYKFKMKSENNYLIWIPNNYANGILSVKSNSVIEYFITQPHNKKFQKNISYIYAKKLIEKKIFKKIILSKNDDI